MSKNPLTATWAITILQDLANHHRFSDRDSEALHRVIEMLESTQANNPPALSFLNDAQTKAIARVMTATPVRIMEDEYCEAYAVHADAYGESVTAHFGKWQKQYISASEREMINGEATGKMLASRVSIPEHDFTKMDALCKAWIQFRVKMERDDKREEAPADDDLGDLREHPF